MNKHVIIALAASLLLLAKKNLQRQNRQQTNTKVAF